MRIPVVLASVGPHESSWVRRRGLRTLRVEGSDGSMLVAQCECGRQASFGGDGEFNLDFECKSMKLKHHSKSALSVDLV